MTRRIAALFLAAIAIAGCGVPDDPPPRIPGPRPIPPPPPRPLDAGIPEPLDAGPPLPPDLSCDELFLAAGPETMTPLLERPCNRPSLPLLGYRAQAMDPLVGEPPERVCWRVRAAAADTGWRAGATIDGSSTLHYLVTGGGAMEWTYRFVDAAGRAAGSSFTSPGQAPPDENRLVDDRDVVAVFGRFREVGYATRSAVVWSGGRIEAPVELAAGTTELFAAWLEPSRAGALVHGAEVSMPVPAGGAPLLAVGPHRCPSLWVAAGHGREVAIAVAECRPGDGGGELVPAGTITLAIAEEPEEIAIVDDVLVARAGTALEARALPGGEPMTIDPAIGPVRDLVDGWAAGDASVRRLIGDPTTSTLRAAPEHRFDRGLLARLGTLRAVTETSASGVLLTGSAGFEVIAAAEASGPRRVEAVPSFGGSIVAATTTIGPGTVALVFAVATPAGTRIFWSDDYFTGCD